MNAGRADKTEIPWERVPYLSALEVCLWQGAIQIHVYLYFCLTFVAVCLLAGVFAGRTTEKVVEWNEVFAGTGVHHGWSTSPPEFGVGDAKAMW